MKKRIVPDSGLWEDKRERDETGKERDEREKREGGKGKREMRERGGGEGKRGRDIIHLSSVVEPESLRQGNHS